MKRILSTTLAIASLCALTACGGGSADSTVTSTVSQPTAVPTAVPTAAEAVAVGNTITVDFAEITVAEAAIANDIKTKIKTGNVTYTSGPDASDTTEFVYLRGTIKNTSTSQIDDDYIKGNVVINGYTYDIDSVNIIDSKGSSAFSLDPLVTYTYTLYAEVPNELATAPQSCVVNFGFDENFAWASGKEVDELPYYYSLKLY